MPDPRQTIVDLDSQSFFWDRYLQKGKEAFASERHVQAVSMFTLALKTANNLQDGLRKAQATSWLALSYYELHNYDQAEILLKEILQMSPNGGPDILEQDQNLQLLAALYERQSRYQEAEAALSWLLFEYQRRPEMTGSPSVEILADKCRDLKERHEEMSRREMEYQSWGSSQHAPRSRPV